MMRVSVTLNRQSTEYGEIMPDLPDIDHVLAAHALIAPHVHRTPVLTCGYLDALSGARLFFKGDNFQKTGSFKARGACHAVFSLTDEAVQRGVLTHSSGNHGQALCYAAARRGTAATVVMPQNAPSSKKAAVREYGGTIIECAPTNFARQAVAARVQQRTGATLVHPYNDVRVIAGQGTCALELLDQTDALDAVVAPVGGGGLVAGTCIVLRALSTHTRIYAAEPSGADDAWRSRQAGQILPQDHPRTIADGLRTGLGDLTWPFVCRDIDDILLVQESDIIVAMRLIWERMKLVVEPSAAVPLAAILAQPTPFRGQRVGIILTGGNADLDTLSSVLDPPEEHPLTAVHH